ncbi:hypothetical protein RRG08_000568 [Elysia crispata]|uniref:Uncharacterized protein n=1 Tax=Elysia crispata TaxID=231223 RepID=A0AAE0Y8Q9_9GAST|nr:hypothetical protein RRG08_000568 [Elysia crispata]
MRLTLSQTKDYLLSVVRKTSLKRRFLVLQCENLTPLRNDFGGSDSQTTIPGACRARAAADKDQWCFRCLKGFNEVGILASCVGDFATGRYTFVLKYFSPRSRPQHVDLRSRGSNFRDSELKFWRKLGQSTFFRYQIFLNPYLCELVLFLLDRKRFVTDELVIKTNAGAPRQDKRLLLMLFELSDKGVGGTRDRDRLKRSGQVVCERDTMPWLREQTLVSPGQESWPGLAPTVMERDMRTPEIIYRRAANTRKAIGSGQTARQDALGLSPN